MTPSPWPEGTNVWGHDVPPPVPDVAPQRVIRDGRDLELAADEAWRELLQEHMPFQAITDEERARLLESLRRSEDAALDAPTILHKWPDPAAHMGKRDAKSGRSSEPQAPQVIMLQLRLMEQAFLTLRLDRYANAPINHGWINLFRLWGRSHTFVDYFERVRPLFSVPFVHFFEDFVKERDDIEAEPVPHPWDHRADARRDELKALRQELETRRPGAVRPVLAPGVFLDSGIIEDTGYFDPSAAASALGDEQPKEGDVDARQPPDQQRPEASGPEEGITNS